MADTPALGPTMSTHRWPSAVKVALLLLVAACVEEPAEDKLLDSVRLETIRGGTALLSSSEFLGRGTGEPGGERAARWIAEQFGRMGLEPAGDDSTFLQSIRLRRSSLSNTSLVVIGADTLRLREDFAVMVSPSSDALELRGEAVFISYGIVDDALGRRDLSGVDVAGKVVVLLGGLPAGVDSTAFMRAAMTQQEQLASARALLVADLGTRERPFEAIAADLLRDGMTLDADGGSDQGPLVLAISDGAIDRLLGGSYAAVKRRADAGEYVTRTLAPAQISIRRDAEPVTSWNVVGLLRGEDPALREEVVVYTAHYDAFGATSSGTYYPGAIDNALGTSQLLAVAEAFGTQRHRLRRSVLFMAVTAEEYGLLGTRAWLEEPTYPVEQVVAALNFDASDSEVYGPLEQAVGLGADRSSLGEVFRAAARDLGVLATEDPYPEQNLFMRSDHFAFVQRGIPGLMLIGAPAGDAWVDRSRHWLGPEGDYHQPTDTVREDWDFRGPQGSARLMALIGWRVANGDDRPRQNPDVP